MYKQPLGRNNRSRGFKIKHLIQLLVLVGIFIWLIYQVKHSHDKRREFDEKISKSTTSSLSNDGDNEVIKFGRKDVKGRLEKMTLVKDGKVEEDGGVGDQEYNKNEVDEQEEEKEDESRGDGDFEEDGGGGGGDPEDIKSEDDEEEEDIKDGEGKDTQNSEEGERRSVREEEKGHHEAAREEHYKADYASSEVAHETESESSTSEVVVNDSSNNLTSTMKMDKEGQNQVQDDEDEAKGLQHKSRTSTQKTYYQSIVLEDVSNANALSESYAVEVEAANGETNNSGWTE